ncbi:hypothetical protein FA09DRAFT_2525 [Tilletiopsis washingtonensis]|uniref:Secreted protein n=1 Tax=Tilletiopsis washingtonensis TaxID=58919 RepID=A0A316ZJ32_9BASI|nr:hypothetical protein FA09DRAFT_2525 [Tilletiopsis washingtonensis]PWO01119.1 hypothetical protein FA09DRAFT_2525 [Tilletiopsis washingtonensis]
MLLLQLQLLMQLSLLLLVLLLRRELELSVVELLLQLFGREGAFDASAAAARSRLWHAGKVPRVGREGRRLLPRGRRRGLVELGTGRAREMLGWTIRRRSQSGVGQLGQHVDAAERCPCRRKGAATICRAVMSVVKGDEGSSAHH